MVEANRNKAIDISILVVVVTHNALQWLDKCLGSVYNSSIALDVMIIDNNSDDGTQSHILTHYPQISFIQNNANFGFGKANNIGLQYALDNNYDYVYLLNQDAWLMEDTIQSLINVHASHPEFGILSPFQVQANMRYLDVNFIKYVCSFESNVNVLNDFYWGNREVVYPVSNVMAAHWLISKACLQQTGGFSPSFAHYGEDDNYVERAQYHKFLVGIVPCSVAVHDRESRTDSIAKNIHMQHIGHIKMLSSINNGSSMKLLRVIYSSFRGCIVYRSFKPFHCLCKILISYNNIRKCKKKSLNKCAFLSNTDK